MPVGGGRNPDQPKYTVINEKLIKECIYIPPSSTDEEKKSRDRDTKAPKQQLEFYEVECLVFSFRHVTQIDNLVGFDRLVKLQLDNNHITKIENLAHLVNLQWLDLSFNDITTIEGLEALTQLTDLTLYCNNISKLQGMETLTKLNCFSVGKNSLQQTDLDAVAKYLRQFKNLRMLTLAGNPLVKHPSYESKILAHVKHLKYLDYHFVEKSKVEKANQDQREQLVEIENEESKKEDELQDAEAKVQVEKNMANANLSGMNSLFDEMLRDDPEAKNMNAFMEIDQPLKDAVEKYRTRFTDQVVDEFKTKMIDHRARKDAELEEFQSTLETAKAETDMKCKDIMRLFEKKKKKVIAASQKEVDGVEDEWQQLHQELDSVQEQLLELETDQVEAYEDVIKTFEQIYTELTEQTIETITQYFQRMRDEEKTYFDEIFEIFNKMVEARHSEQQTTGLGVTTDTSFVDDQNKQVMGILDNKEDVMKMINESHEAHEQKMYTKEEQLIQNEKKQLEEMSQKNITDEHTRNRNRVCEINMYVQLQTAEIAPMWETDENSYYHSV
eukprot:TRINITY_DN2107_c0_g1_i1.p1 TRINITY_DN2107_c0_g1~~TRINITY_DN2107_c0_g1_i1.p1  ORF type:complete len:564 (+),score=85.64 TRINITY_DN2107_c0_g1_i1:26-1693(+)